MKLKLTILFLLFFTAAFSQGGGVVKVGTGTVYPYNDSLIAHNNRIGAVTVSNATKEASLGNPASNGYYLSSTTGGIRSWVAGSSSAAKQDTLNVYLPETYGALGDGTTDDAPAFTSMINAMNIRGGYVHLAAKTYLLSSTVTIAKPIIIQGEGVGTTLKMGSNNMVMLKVVEGHTVFRDMMMTSSQVSPSSGCFIRIDTNARTGSSVQEFLADNITFSNGYNQIEAINAFGWGVNNCKFYFINYAIKVSSVSAPDAGDSYIANSYFYPNGLVDGNIAIYQTNSGGLRIYGNKANINGTAKYNYFYYGAITGTTDLLMAINSIENFKAGAVRIIASPVNSFGNITIVGNQISSLTTIPRPSILIDSVNTVNVTGNVLTKYPSSADTAIVLTNVSVSNLNNTYYGYTNNVFYAGTFSSIVGDRQGGTAINKLYLPTGSNASVGTATLVGGTVTVSTTAALTASLIVVSVKTPGGTQGFLSVPTIVNATSFTINSTSASETSTINWWIIN